MRTEDCPDLRRDLERFSNVPTRAASFASWSVAIVGVKFQPCTGHT